MDKNWIDNYIKSLDLHEIRDATLREKVESIIRRYLQTADMVDAFRKISLIQNLVNMLKGDVGDLSLLETVEHVKSKIEEGYGVTLSGLFEYAPKSDQYRVPPVFYEHPQLMKIRVLKEDPAGKIVDSETINVDQLKIHYIIGSLDLKVVDKEEKPVKILCGKVRFDQNCGRHVLLNNAPHFFTIKKVNDEIHLVPNTIHLRIVPSQVLEGHDVRFCPSCYNIYDEDEIQSKSLIKHQEEIKRKIRAFNADIEDDWRFCPYCSEKISNLTDPNDIKRILLFSYLYRSNFFPDVVPIVERSASMDKKSAKNIPNADDILNLLVVNAMYGNDAHVSEFITGFMRLFEMHRDEQDKPNKPIYRWQKDKLRKDDKSIYYYYQVGKEKIPAKINIEIEKTDAITFEIRDLQEIYLMLKPSLLLDLIFSCFRIYLYEEYPRANTFALDTACEAIFSYILLSRDIKTFEDSKEVIDSVQESVNELQRELYCIKESCKRQNLEFQLFYLPTINQIITVPFEQTNLCNYVEFQIGEEKLKVSRKLALLLWLFGICDPVGNLYISGVKKRPGLDFYDLVEKIYNRICGKNEFKSFIKQYAKDIYLHTLSHLLYRSVIEVAKCDENDVSYDYNVATNEVIVYDDYPGGAGFIEECVESFDNMKYEMRVRPQFGLLQQLESNLNTCSNYLINYLLYETVHHFDLDELRRFTYQKPTRIVEKIKSVFDLSDAFCNNILAKVYGKNLLNSVFSLVKYRVALAYKLLRKIFDFSYDDLLLVQKCPTVTLFTLLCKLNDHDLSIFLKDVLREDVKLREGNQFSLISELWEQIFESSIGVLFSNFHRNYLPRFEDLISTCLHGCYDCTYNSFGCKYPFQEQEFRINTYLPRLVISNLRRKSEYTFPTNQEELEKVIDILKKERTVYLYFYAKDYSKIEKIFNIFLNRCLTDCDMEHCQPFFNFEIDGNQIKVLIKLRKRVQK